MVKREEAGHGLPRTTPRTEAVLGSTMA